MSYFLVFQNKSYQEERKGEYLWAPQENARGQSFHHWKEMKNVKPGDIIFNSFEGEMRSIILPQSKAIEQRRPVDLDKLELWHYEGWFIDAEYIDLENPISYKELMDTILELQSYKYSPFNVAGRGNTGYLFQVNENLGDFLMSALENSNGKSKRETIKSVSQKLEEKQESFNNIIQESYSLYNTETQALIKSRLGHSSFKKALMIRGKECVICGLKNKDLLIASHIKPWVKSNNQERLDAYNGLLLCPNHDALFDRGLISFQHDGELLVSEELHEETKDKMNLTKGLVINMSEKQKEYMKWHRENLLK